MAKIEYVPKLFRPADLAIIEQADAICQQYASAGYSLTLRQTFYQFVARALIPNREQSYDKLGRLISDGRLAGLIDWDHIVDRTRRWQYLPHWGTPNQEGYASAQTFVEAVMPQFRTLKWETQPYYIEVWVEKEALIDVIAQPANQLDLSYFACRGYTSQSSQHEAAMRFVRASRKGKELLILHLGDHDPSGIDMSRDILARINLFVNYWTGQDVTVSRLALNMDQVERYNPPPNPAKFTDSRAGDYVRRFGQYSWELDALDPPTIDGLITAAVESVRDEDVWAEALRRERAGKTLLADAVSRWDEIRELLEA